MITRSVTWLGLMVVWFALGAPVQAQDDQPAIEDPSVADEAPPMPAAVAPARVAPSAVSLPMAAQCSTACPTTASSIDARDHSDTGWLIIGIGGSIAAGSLALGTSMMVQANGTAESRLGSATLAAGITGVAVSVLVGLLAM